MNCRWTQHGAMWVATKGRLRLTVYRDGGRFYWFISHGHGGWIKGSGEAPNAHRARKRAEKTARW